MKNKLNLNFSQFKAILILCSMITCLQFVKGQDKDSVVSLPEIRVTSTSTVTQKVYSAFEKAFPGAQNLRWYRLDRDYLAKYILKEMDHSTLYKQNGYMVYDISYGFQKHLPKDVEQLVIRNYNDYRIFRAINVRFQGRDVWVIKMENGSKYLTVRVEDNEIEEVEEFNKSTD